MYNRVDIENLFVEIESQGYNLCLLDAEKYFCQHHEMLDRLLSSGDIVNSLVYCDNKENDINLWDIYFHFICSLNKSTFLHSLFDDTSVSSIFSVMSGCWANVSLQINNSLTLIYGGITPESLANLFEANPRDGYTLLVLYLLFGDKYKDVLHKSWRNGEPLVTTEKVQGENVYNSLYEALSHYLLDEFYIFLQKIYAFVINQ